MNQLIDLMASRHNPLNHFISLRLQDDYTIRAGLECEYNHSLLGMYQELEVIVNEDSLLPEAFDLEESKISLFRDWLQLGIILYQSGCLNYCYSSQVYWKNEFPSIPTEVYLITLMIFHLSKHETNLESVNILISQLKFERFLVAFLLKDTDSTRIAFLAYRESNLIETDRIFRAKILKYLDKYEHMEWKDLSNNMNKVLSHLKETRTVLLNQIIRHFSLQNDKAVSQIISDYYDLTQTTPHYIPRVFYNTCVDACMEPLSNTRTATHLDTIINKLHSILDSNLDDEQKCFIRKNFLFSKIFSPNLSTEESNRIISKFAPADELNQSFSPEDDQDVSLLGYIDVLLQLVSVPDHVTSFLKLICSRKYPLIDSNFRLSC